MGIVYIGSKAVSRSNNLRGFYAYSRKYQLAQISVTQDADGAVLYARWTNGADMRTHFAAYSVAREFALRAAKLRGALYLDNGKVIADYRASLPLAEFMGVARGNM